MIEHNNINITLVLKTLLMNVVVRHIFGAVSRIYTFKSTDNRYCCVEKKVLYLTQS